MAHRLTVTNDKAEMAYYGDTPWHGLGTKLVNIATSAEMLTAAGLAWDVEKTPLYTQRTTDPCCEVHPGSGAYIAVPGSVATRRMDTGAVLGVVTDGYRVIQNRETFALADEIIGSAGAKWHTAGSLQGGRKVWALAEFPHYLTIGPKGDQSDDVQLFLLFAQAFDGSLAWSAVPTGTRVVCWNTLTLALGIDLETGRQAKQRDGYYIRHSESADVRIEEARRVLGLVTKQFEIAGQMFNALSATQLDSLGMRTYLERVIPMMLPSRVPTTEQLEEAAEKQRGIHEAVLVCAESGRGAELESSKGTVWGAYNAVTEYVDHVYPMTKAGTVSRARLQSVAFGTHADLKRRALVEAVALVNQN